jgi:anti-sigma-K factor RskA
VNSPPIDTEQDLASYLSGRLPARESAAFEERASEHPEVRREIEQTLKFKEGLARLRERGELDGVVRTQRAQRWLPYAAAAAVVLATLTSVLWLQRRNSIPEALFLSPSAVAAYHHRSSPLRGSYVLARTRGSADVIDVRLPAPGTIELRILPADASPDSRYIVDLKRVDRRDGKHMGRIEGASAGADGYVVVYADSSELTPGEYEISLGAAVPTATHAVTDRFVIRLQSP